MLRNVIFQKKQAHKYTWLAIKKDSYFFAGLEPSSIENIFGNVREIIEIYLWAMLNRYSLKKIRFSIQKSEKLLYFVHKTLITDKKNDIKLIEKNLKILKSIEAEKIAHITHYFYGAQDLRSRLQEIDTAYIAGEIDPRLFPDVSAIIGDLPFLKIPFKSSDRFVNIKSFSDRKNRVIATGTIAPPISDIFFQKCFRTNCLQPERLYLLNYTKLKNTSIDCYIENLYSEADNGSKKEYFGLSLPELYNQYKYCLVTSEVVGFPQIAIYEATLSGCVIIALNDGVMEALGFEAQKSYLRISNFDDVESLVKTRTIDEDIALWRNAVKVCISTQSEL